MSPSEASLLLAEKVREDCAEQGLELLLIGAVALAAHGYPRQTEDIDFAVAVPPSTLPALATHLEHLGVQAELSSPDPQHTSPASVTAHT